MRRLVGWNKIFDVDKGFGSVGILHFHQRFVNQIRQIESLPLTAFGFISQIESRQKELIEAAVSVAIDGAVLGLIEKAIDNFDAAIFSAVD
jgi:hypothetical protein